MCKPQIARGKHGWAVDKVLDRYGGSVQEAIAHGKQRIQASKTRMPWLNADAANQEACQVDLYGTLPGLLPDPDALVHLIKHQLRDQEELSHRARRSSTMPRVTNKVQRKPVDKLETEAQGWPPISVEASQASSSGADRASIYVEDNATAHVSVQVKDTATAHAPKKKQTAALISLLQTGDTEGHSSESLHGDTTKRAQIQACLDTCTGLCHIRCEGCRTVYSMYVSTVYVHYTVETDGI